MYSKVNGSHFRRFWNQKACSIYSNSFKHVKHNKESTQILDECDCANNSQRAQTEARIEIFDGIIKAVSKLIIIQYMHCTVDTPRLAIRGRLKDHHASTVINTLRKVVVAAMILFCRNMEMESF